MISLQAMSVEQRELQPWSLPRAHPRFLLDLRLIVKTKETQHGRTKDIAEGGLGATIPGEIALGEIVELELQLSGTSGPLKLKAEVRYRRGFQYGFMFLQATEQEKELIRRTMHTLRPAP
jgi:hypothetical protein